MVVTTVRPLCTRSELGRQSHFLHPHLEKGVWDGERPHLRQPLQHLHDAQGGGGVQPRGGLVQQQNGGVDEDLVPDTHTLPLAPGHTAQERAPDDGVTTPVQTNS